MKDMRLILIEPELEDYWYEKQLLEDPNTMDYNAGYEVSYEGYHYDIGCIDFPKSKWEASYQKRETTDRFFAYLKDNIKDCYVGYVNYQYNPTEKRYECGILIEDKYRGLGYSKEGLYLLCDTAFKNGVDALYDSFEKDRISAIKVFEEIGFQVIETSTWKKFDEIVEGVTICLTKEQFYKKKENF